MNNNRPYYRKLYQDMIRNKYPEKEKDCSQILNKEKWTSLDVLMIDKMLFVSNRKQSDIAFGQRHRAYDKQTIIEILDYQQKNELNNGQIANEFQLSRNTVTKWRKLFERETVALNKRENVNNQLMYNYKALSTDIDH